jgi:hypothetical protein
MKITADDEKLLIGDNDGHLYLISLRHGELIKDFGRVHCDYFTAINITLDQKFFCTSAIDGGLTQ